MKLCQNLICLQCLNLFLNDFVKFPHLTSPIHRRNTLLMNVRAFYINALVIFSIIMVGISPACAFISGTSFIQICAADGSVQTVEVDAALDPFAQSANKQMPLSDHLEAMEQCSYCFAMDHYKYGEAYSQVITISALPRYLAVSQGTAIPVGSKLTLYQPRGPPQFS